MPVRSTEPLAVTAALKVLGAYTVSVLLLLLPSTTLPEAVSKPVSVTELLAVTAALKDVAAFTVRVWLPLVVPRTVFPFTVTAPARISASG